MELERGWLPDRSRPSDTRSLTLSDSMIHRRD